MLQIQESSNPNVGNLIDFGDEDSGSQQPQPLHEQLAGLSKHQLAVLYSAMQCSAVPYFLPTFSPLCSTIQYSSM